VAIAMLLATESCSATRGVAIPAVRPRQAR
jgi:hypothetical protein